MEQSQSDEQPASSVKKSHLKKLLYPLIFVGVGVLMGIGVFVFTMPQVSTSFKAANDDLSFVKTEYGAQDVSWEKYSLMKVTINGQKVDCGQPSAANREAHAPIKCANGITLYSNRASNQ